MSSDQPHKLKIKNLRQNVSLAPLTTYKIGGPADYFVEVTSKAELVDAVKAARESEVSYFLLGCGANILIGDKGFRGLVIHNLANNYRFSKNDLICESGATIADLIKVSVNHGLSGLENFAGIPSSVGGALWQNLHFLSPDRQKTIYIGGITKSAEIMDEKGQIRTVDHDYFHFGYDDSILHHKKAVVLEATFSLSPKSTIEMKQQIEENLKWRRERHPQLDDYPSCGSVFKKIKDVGAGRLIDAAGLKGRRIGDAMISEEHANYIINLGHAKSSDVIQLMKLVEERVLEHSGYHLKPEIGLIGEF